MNQETYWRAVAESDRRFDGAFVYAVRSTGIYCRPSCPSRRPRREQVVFFAAPESAERAGFRPCRRCRPGDATAQPQAELVQRVCHYIDAHPDDHLTLQTLGALAGASPHHLQRTFKRALGITPRQYAESRRVGRLKAGLRKGHSVTRALYDAGYGSSSRLYERSNARLGMTPATYRRGGEHMHIKYTITDCPLGRLLVGATERGVCAVSIGESDRKLETFLRDEYPRARITRDANGLQQWATAILQHLHGRQKQLDLPVDVEATAFQWRVWEELKAIPYGATRTYSEVARAMGRPTATRAVARACATNPVAVVIPCHRVIRTDGGLGGYRWGLDRKKALLAQERAPRRREAER
ncbi:MAG TPA: bifunctional DNA-binding transcriptional regulator/O6-methylguanine-DNA methyltransferase Ada [Bryobacterales bacterium]|nr:bifunctional DNA-binding transcriptional regulator/O6-methylguanine-DNA methyltransferase Ada [Bryobacterales bacterium]